ncbi:Apolipoprotein B-100 [Echinococcus multilocularis]|uniref:Apolipoprotein B-100 n=1 Tax=Echinococcus multilocularis TaxID=6211 RepID=A0A0S4MLF6_ECHMU|nr:Apolipoprotein B-100 [Echinococcus multilocularis]
MCKSNYERQLTTSPLATSAKTQVANKCIILPFAELLYDALKRYMAKYFSFDLHSELSQILLERKQVRGLNVESST